MVTHEMVRANHSNRSIRVDTRLGTILNYDGIPIDMVQLSVYESFSTMIMSLSFENLGGVQQVNIPFASVWTPVRILSCSLLIDLSFCSTC
jgi:hypothetical protein